MGENKFSLIDDIINGIKTEHLDRKKLTKSNKNKLFYVAKQADGKLKVTLPFVFKREDFLGLNKYGIEGSTGYIIKRIKEQIRKGGFSILSGSLSRRYEALYEPITLANCDLNIGSDLWRADRYNHIENENLHLLLRMIFEDKDTKTIATEIDELAGKLNEFIQKIPYKDLEKETLNIVNQKDLRNRLDELGLVCFIGDNSKPAREYTRIRRHYRIAGPKKGVNVEFKTPMELNPIEVELFDGNVITGLGIKKREIFIITGRNTQGKSTLLEAIESGQDDHLIGDGREYIITTNKVSKATTGTMQMNGQDISLFFQKLPKGIKGNPKKVYGTASGSMTMAYQIQRALNAKMDLILIDEDNSAVNLLVSGLLSKWFEGVKSLAEIIMNEREKLTSSFIIVTSSLDLLTACGDRAIYLEDHEAKYLNLKHFNMELGKYYLNLGTELYGRKVK
ncbi:P-loop domain-containing protein [Methanotorris formicicus]|uniref:ABC transporter, ATPase, predicted n=1 Tax=Methanotorris formicicus Mc-S-70 TaxID=647171 RepID=H1KY27_9EURY|nr:P-loop domain-containing protein [Methanotorris formicicus]EHP87579.1 ABC transporter, ATPase, predicted [Methanotorris formicicus Mc-S-70]